MLSIYYGKMGVGWYTLLDQWSDQKCVWATFASWQKFLHTLSELDAKFAYEVNAITITDPTVSIICIYANGYYLCKSVHRFCAHSFAESDNCPSWISGRERMTVENISWSIPTKECCRPRRGLNPRSPGLQSDGASNWATEAGRSIGIRF